MKTTQKRVVIDTYALISTLLFSQGALAWLRDTWQSGDIHPLASDDTAAEFIRVLSYPKFQLTEREKDGLISDYLPWCETVTVPPSTRTPKPRDPSDRPFIALALAANVDALITGDRDLLDLADVFSVPIITPAELKRELGRV